MRHLFQKPHAWVLTPFTLGLALIIACGGSATATPPPNPTSRPPATLPSGAPTQPPTTVPTPAPESTTPGAGGEAPTGTLRIAYNEIGPPQLLSKNAGYPSSSINLVTIFETGWRGGPNGELEPGLVKEWSISPDNLVWTLKLQEGVQFHKGWGEFTAEDLKFSIETFIAEDSIGNAAPVRPAYTAEGASMTVVDDYTLVVNTGNRPSFDLTWGLWSFGSWPIVTVTSKEYVESVGEDKATLEGIGTSPWEFVEYRSAEVFRMKAVQDHWRKTPNFAELEVLEIPEVSTRVANFQAGQLDSMHMNPESLPAIEDVPGVKFMRFPGAFQLMLNIHGQNYMDRPDDPPRDTSLPWVSASADTSSPEWERARKVREAMSIAIDRQQLVDELLLGEGKPAHIWNWQGHDARLGYLKDLKFEYNPDRARQLLEEAGYGDGFEIDMALTFLPYASIIEAGQAACVMWEAVNIRCRQQNQPMTAFRPNFVNRSWKGVNTHGISTLIEPMSAYQNLINSKGLINFGMEHPKLDEFLAKMNETFDTEERWERQREANKWIFENVAHIPLIEGNFIYPLGRNIDEWELQCCFYSHLNNLEYTPHRQ